MIRSLRIIPVLRSAVYSNTVKFKNTAKFITATNEMPPTADLSTGMMRRLLIIPFDAEFIEGKNEDKSISEKLHSEKSGILNRFIEGYQRLVSQKGFSKSSASDEAREEYVLENDIVKSFYKDCCSINESDDTFISVDDLYAQFREYSVDQGINKFDVLTKPSFAKRFKRSCPVRYKRTSSSRGYRFLEVRSTINANF
jgi:putative DNA primase/helicase